MSLSAKNMTELIKKVAKQNEVSERIARDIIKSTFQEILSSADDYGRLAVPDFGIFNVVDRPSRMGRNPRTGEAIEISAKRMLRFKISTTADRLINQAD